LASPRHRDRHGAGWYRLCRRSHASRNNADWYRLLDLCALTRTLIADTDISHPGDFSDRLVLGLNRLMT
jgi:hypothetical protein